MSDRLHLWLRDESHPTERRAPIAPADARVLVGDGIDVTVEESERRVFATAAYAAAGCRVVEPGTWPNAPADAVIVGLKEPAGPDALTHRHVYFGHAYSGQINADRVLRRFTAGGGQLLDLEYLTDDTGRRVAAFGYWAGYVGAALAVLHSAGRLRVPLRPLTRPELNMELRGCVGAARTAVVIGSLGRSGRGARDALCVAAGQTTRWDLAETQHLDSDVLLDHDILVNAVATTAPGPPFLTAADLDNPARALAVISDVTCDVTSDRNRLPVYDRITSWARPVRRLRDGPPPADLIAIDNLPSLLPVESSTSFSADLLAHLRSLATGSPVWRRCRDAFGAAVGRDPSELEDSDV